MKFFSKHSTAFWLFCGIWILLLLISLLLIFRAVPVLSSWDMSLSDFTIKHAVCRAVLDTYAPGLSFLASQDDTENSLETASGQPSVSLAEHIRSLLFRLCNTQWRPACVYISQKSTSPLISESELSDGLLSQAAAHTSAAPNANADTQNPAPALPQTSDPNSVASAGSATPADQTNAIQANTSPKGIVYQPEQLADFSFVLNTFFTLDATTTIDESLLNAPELLTRDLTLQKDASVPQILIYHTHSQETFADSIPGDPSTGIVGVGAYLAKLLTETYGYQVIHNTSSYDLINGTLDRNKAYSQSLHGVEEILAEHPSIQVVIDLHRDGINGNKMTTMIDGKETAKIMFFNGLSRSARNGALESLPNPYISDNLAFSLQLKLQAEAYYPDFTRPIYLKCYRYNLHLRPRCLLVEAGSQKNTLQEELNAMEVLAKLLDQVLQGTDG